MQTSTFPLPRSRRPGWSRRRQPKPVYTRRVTPRPLDDLAQWPLPQSGKGRAGTRRPGSSCRPFEKRALEKRALEKRELRVVAKGRMKVVLPSRRRRADSRVIRAASVRRFGFCADRTCGSAIRNGNALQPRKTPRGHAATAVPGEDHPASSITMRNTKHLPVLQLGHTGSISTGYADTRFNCNLGRIRKQNTRNPCGLNTTLGMQRRAYLCQRLAAVLRVLPPRRRGERTRFHLFARRQGGTLRRRRCPCASGFVAVFRYQFRN